MQEASTVTNYAGILSVFVWFLVQQSKQKTDPLLRLYRADCDLLHQIETLVTESQPTKLDTEPDPDALLPLPDLVTELLCSLFQTNVGAKVCEWVYPPMNFLALSMYKPDHSFDKPEVLTHRIAAIQYVVRLAFAEEFLSHGPDPDAWDPDSDPKDAPADDFRMFSWLHKGITETSTGADAYASTKVTGCFNLLRQLMRLITTLLHQEAMPTTTCWVDRDQQTLQIEDHTITISGVRDAILSIERRAQYTLDELTEGCVLPDFDTSLYKDQPTNTSPYQNYLSFSSRTHDRYATHLIDQWMSRKDKHKLLKPIWKSELSKVVKGSEDIIWNTCNIRNWLMKADQLLEMLYFLYHVASGQPMRGTEEESTRLVNSCTNSRNIFWRGDQFVIVTWYHKGRNQTGNTKPRMTFLPGGHSKMWHYYLGFVRPAMV